MKDKFRFLVFMLVVCVCAMSVSAQETDSATRQLSIKRTGCQQNANQLFKQTQVAQLKYAAPFKTPDLARTNQGFLPGFAFVNPSPSLAFLIDEPGVSTEMSGPIDWACFAACYAAGLPATMCLHLCNMN